LHISSSYAKIRHGNKNVSLLTTIYLVSVLFAQKPMKKTKLLFLCTLTSFMLSVRVVSATYSDIVLDTAINQATPTYFENWLTSAHEGNLHHESYVSLSFPSKIPEPAKRVSRPKPALAKPVPDSSYDHFFDRYGNQFNVPVPTLKTIAFCESRYNPNSVSKNHTYGGMYQFSSSTWASTRNAMGLDPDPALRFDAEQAIMTAAFKIASGGIRAWPTLQCPIIICHSSTLCFILLLLW
jgi:hypothetical protein